MPRLAMFLFCSRMSNMSRNFPIALVALASCSQPAPTENLEIKFLDGQVKSIDNRVRALEMARNTQADLKPTEKEFSFLDTELGPIAISVEDVSASANGSVAKMRFGNASAASITGMKYTVAWGSVDSQGIDETASQHTAEKELPGPLLGGSWNTVKLTLADIPPAKLGYIRISNPRISTITLTPR